MNKIIKRDNSFWQSSDIKKWNNQSEKLKEKRERQKEYYEAGKRSRDNGRVGV